MVLQHNSRHPLEARLARREMWLVGDIDQDMFVQQIVWLHQLLDVTAREPIKLFIASDGGDISLALALQTILENCGTSLVTVAAGAVHSAAIAPYMAGRIRLAYPSSFFLVHAVQGMTAGNLSDMDADRQFIDKLIDEEVKRLVAHTNWPASKWRNIFRGRAAARYFSLGEMMEAGVVHHTVAYPDIERHVRDLVSAERLPSTT